MPFLKSSNAMTFILITYLKIFFLNYEKILTFKIVMILEWIFGGGGGGFLKKKFFF